MFNRSDARASRATHREGCKHTANQTCKLMLCNPNTVTFRKTDLLSFSGAGAASRWKLHYKWAWRHAMFYSFFHVDLKKKKGKKKNIDTRLASEFTWSLIQEEAGRDRAHVHSSDSNKEPIVGSTCLHKSPLCSWLGGSGAKSLFITPTVSLCPLPLCHVHFLSSDNLGRVYQYAESVPWGHGDASPRQSGWF